ncbi:MAG: LacI family transcriptional regulator [Frankiales bacterium]|jgi:LacI family transcriptional regulator|nr:LacI family transcriptional regulator [Frankiales bacterium]MDX6211329.1 LacI family transcriptional regulator [Frankiales bacterium]MDX6223260.1 LacI family transcriptional regulator [Frankiales bacterium]
MERVKLIDVARAAGVHPGTASRALSPEAGSLVSAETARRVVRAAERLGYVPNTVARGLRTARSFLIGMVVPDVTNPLFPPMVRGAEQVLSRAGFTLVLTDTDNDAETERRQVEQLRARGTDGFLIATARWEDALVQQLADAGVPAVLVNRNSSPHRLPYVGGDERTGVAEAVEHLVTLGHRSIVHLAGPQDTSTGRERASAFRHALRQHGLPVGRGQVRTCAAYSEQAGLDACTRLLSSSVEFTAILAGNDLIALGALTALAGAGRRCPDDVSVVGFNDLPLVDKLTPALTTVTLPLHEMGALSAQILLGAIDEPGRTGPVAQSLLGIKLAVRGSTGPARP